MAAGEREPPAGDRRTVAAARAILEGDSRRGPVSRLLPFLGPAFIASVAYVDPGQLRHQHPGRRAVRLHAALGDRGQQPDGHARPDPVGQAGHRHGQNLAEHCRMHFPPAGGLSGMWVLMEAGGHGHRPGRVPRRGARLQPAVRHAPVGGRAADRRRHLPDPGPRALRLPAAGGGHHRAAGRVIAVCYLVETVLDRPDWGQVLVHAVVPRFAGPRSVVLAAGILGATVMPHAIFLHSALTQGRIRVSGAGRLRRLLPLRGPGRGPGHGGGQPGQRGHADHGRLRLSSASGLHAGRLPSKRRTARWSRCSGRAASWVFALSLLASGLSSSTVGTSAGQVIMQGFLQRHIPSGCGAW